MPPKPQSTGVLGVSIFLLPPVATDTIYPSNGGREGVGNGGAHQVQTATSATALRIGKQVEPGYYADGGGLHFQISPSGSRSWIFKFTLCGRTREMGLGPLSSVSLAAARAEAANAERCSKRKSIRSRRATLSSAAARSSTRVLECSRSRPRTT